MQRILAPIQSRLKDCALACTVGLTYFAAAYFSLYLTQGMAGLATIWPASGVFVSALFLTKPNKTAPIVVAVGVMSIAANMLSGVSVATALAFTCANLVEGLLISQLLIRTSGVPRTLDDTRWLATFLGATVVGGAISGTIAAVLSGQISLAFFVSWFMTVCLGTLIVTPLIVTTANGLRSYRPAFWHRNALNLLAFVLGVATITSLAFAYEDGRFLFLPVLAVVAAAYRFGAHGAAISIGLIAVIATLQTDFSGATIGPLSLNADTLFLQFYLLSLLGAAWPLSALISQQEKLIDQYSETNMYLKMAERTARVGHWVLGPDNTSLVWSEEVYRIHGVKPADMNFDEAMDLREMTSLDLYHPDDREGIRKVLVTAMERREAFSYQGRVVQPDGTIKYVSSIGKPRYTSSGEFNGLFGTFQDVSEQTETLDALRVARIDALREATVAQRLAETDYLTGIANRRKTFANLRFAARTAKHSGEPVTIAIFDIDHFKAVNDRHGHQTGDEVLKRVAKIVSAQIRPNDFFGRMGGEEFLVILPGKDGSGAFDIVEQIRLDIASETWPVVGLETITVSAGLATLNQTGDIEDALQRADQALYQAKEGGRNVLRLAA